MSTPASILSPNEWFTQLHTVIEVLEQSIQQKNIRQLRTYPLDTLIRTAQHALLAPCITESASVSLSVVYHAQIAKQLLALQKLINNLPRFFIPYCSSLYLRQKNNQLYLLKKILADLKEALQKLKQLLDKIIPNTDQSATQTKKAKKARSRMSRR